MLGIGEGELLIIVAFAFMIFGPDSLPAMGRTLGRALRQFRQAQEGLNEVVQTEVMDPLQEAMGDPMDTGTRKQRRQAAEERAAALEQDADIELDPTQEAPAHKETFAERKARLAAERAAREQQAAAEEAAASDASSDVSDASSNAADVPSISEGPHVAQEIAAAVPLVEELAPASAEPAQEEEPPKPTAASLYAMGGSSSYARARQAKAEEAAAASVAEADGQDGEPAVEDDTNPSAPSVRKEDEE